MIVDSLVLSLPQTSRRIPSSLALSPVHHSTIRLRIPLLQSAAVSQIAVRQLLNAVALLVVMSRDSAARRPPGEGQEIWLIYPVTSQTLNFLAKPVYRGRPQMIFCMSRTIRVRLKRARFLIHYHGCCLRFLRGSIVEAITLRSFSFRVKAY